MGIYVKISFISIFSPFFWFSNIILLDVLIFAPVAASDTASDGATN